MAAATVRRLRLGALAVLLLLLLLLAALYMISGAVQDSEKLSRWFVPLLAFTVGGLVVLALLVAYNLYRLLREYRGRVAGSRLTARLVVLFTLLALAPVSIVYYYSLQFLLRGIDSWFDVQVDTAMEDALRLGRASLDLHKRQLLRDAERMVYDLEDSSKPALALSLGELRAAVDATELALIDRAGRVIASSNVDPDVLVPDLPENSMLQQVAAGENYVGLSPLGEAGQLHVRALVQDPLERGFMLQALFPVPGNIARLSASVQSAYVDFKERAFLRNSIKFSFTLTLSLVLLVGLFAAVWAAFFTARRLVAPVTDIAAGTRAVADGDYDQQLPMPRAHDELAFLVASFNAMTRRIAQARNAAERSRRELQAQHAYLETVLGGLSTGVMALDREGRVETSNPAADQILRLSIREHLGETLDGLVKDHAQLAPFVEQVLAGMEWSGQAWSHEITLYRGEGRQVLLCRRAPLMTEDELHGGQVLVFDDVTTLVKAQRDAAWGEVARRLAHEIKNPLTPIQLSAERLRRKLLPTLDSAAADVLDRSTHTIVQQVEAMKSMVNAFSDYAKPSRLEPEPLQIDDFVGTVVELYRGTAPRVEFEARAPGAFVEADPVRLRQVVHNLIKNAQEAVADRTDGRVRILSGIETGDDCCYVHVSVQDNGPGFEDEILGRVFEPYVTTKSKGTGLGLAIVKKIVEEHGGAITAENAPEGGARIEFRLPSAEASGLRPAGMPAQVNESWGRNRA
jgi:nitrogen fixation/metabolism regulation signal transduction histidine kinase